ncbi:hypothetical protein B1A_09606, partial [mine drainage metagenome]
QPQGHVLLRESTTSARFGGRKILYIWEHIERDMHQGAAERDISIPMASGAVLHG